VKPGNIMLSEGDHPYLTDLGIAPAVFDLSATEVPELASDTQALAEVLDRLVTGAPEPVAAKRPRLIHRMPRRLREVIVRAERSPGSFASAGAFGEAALEAVDATRIRPLREVLSGISDAPKVLIAVAGVALAASVLVFAVIDGGQSGESSEEAQVRNVVEEFTAQPGATSCRLMTADLRDAYGGAARCARRLGSRTPTKVNIGEVRLGSDFAQVTATSPSAGGTFRFELVRSGSDWRVDGVGEGTAASP
jgi:hypothetical protein